MRYLPVPDEATGQRISDYLWAIQGQSEGSYTSVHEDTAGEWWILIPEDGDAKIKVMDEIDPFEFEQVFVPIVNAQYMNEDDLSELCSYFCNGFGKSVNIWEALPSSWVDLGVFRLS